MNATFETAGFTAFTVWAVDKIENYNKVPESLKIPPVLVGTVAAIAQRGVSSFVNEINRNPKFKKTVDVCTALAVGIGLTKPLTQSVAQDLRQAESGDKDIGEVPLHPAALLGVGSALSGTFVSMLDYLSPAKVLAAVSDFPSKKIPIGQYLISFAVTIKSVETFMKAALPLIQENTKLAQALVATFAAGTITAIVLTDALSPSKNESKKKI